MQNNWTVYEHISPSGKVYVGITSIKPEYRWSIAAGRRGVLITDKDDTMHLLVNQADIVGGDINIKTLFYDVLNITYTLTNNTVVTTYKDI